MVVPAEAPTVSHKADPTKDAVLDPAEAPALSHSATPTKDAAALPAALPSAEAIVWRTVGSTSRTSFEDAWPAYRKTSGTSYAPTSVLTVTPAISGAPGR